MCQSLLLQTRSPGHGNTSPKLAISGKTRVASMTSFGRPWTGPIAESAAPTHDRSCAREADASRLEPDVGKKISSPHSPLLPALAQIALKNLLSKPDALWRHLYKLVACHIANDVF